MIASVILQYSFITVFTFLFLEALHAFCIATNVLISGGLVSRPMYLIIGFVAPLIPTVISAAFALHKYKSLWS